MIEEKFAKVVGKVKWFNQFKGYGFVESENIRGDIFLHFSAVNKSGIARLGNNDIILCDVINSDKGYQVSEIIELLQANKREVEEDESRQVEAVMRWFNPLKGFGFAQLSSGEDVFIHSSLLRKYKLTSIESGQKIKLEIHRTSLGYEAIDIVVYT